MTSYIYVKEKNKCNLSLTLPNNQHTLQGYIVISNNFVLQHYYARVSYIFNIEILKINHQLVD